MRFSASVARTSSPRCSASNNVSSTAFLCAHFPKGSTMNETWRKNTSKSGTVTTTLPAHESHVRAIMGACSKQTQSARSIPSLHDDAIAEGYAASRAFKRQHYVTFLAMRSPVPEEPERMAAEIEGRVRKAWSSWGDAFAR